MRKILLTGGAGFIGSYCLEMLLQRYPDYYVVNIDKLTYASDLSRLKKHIKNPNYHFVLGDITDVLLVTHLFNQFQFDAVIHIAAESHVDRSIIDPSLFLKTNVEGTHVLLHAAYTHWFEGPQQVKANFLHHRFLYISTDEVYGSLSNAIDSFREESPMAPTNPYSGSKAAAECLVNAYLYTYGLDTVVTRSTNNYGIGQHPEKLIPMVIDRALKGQSIPLHGDGGMIRTWLHVTDHVRAIDLALHQGKSGHTYNISAHEERTNLDLTHMICKLLDRMKPVAQKSYTSLITFVADRPSQDRRYALDNAKISEQLGWKPIISLQEGLEQLVAHTMKMNEYMKSVLLATLLIGVACCVPPSKVVQDQDREVVQDRACADFTPAHEAYNGHFLLSQDAIALTALPRNKKLVVDVIVNAANSSILGGGGIDRAIHSAAGPQLKVACSSYLKDRSCTAIEVGEVAVTKSFDLEQKCGVRYIIHAVGPDGRVYKNQDDLLRKLVYNAYYNSMKAMNELITTHPDQKLSSIGFPMISVGIYDVPASIVGPAAVEAIFKGLKDFSAIKQVVLFGAVDADEKNRERFAEFQKVYQKYQNQATQMKG